MKLEKKIGEEISLTVTLNELETINNALNEVCNALDLNDFETRMGVTMEEAVALLAHISEVFRKL